MRLTGNTVLITGGATGIGFALAEAFLKKGNTVLICGRREDKLTEAKLKLPELHTRVCDISNQEDREALCEWAEQLNVNVLVNNAGIQRMIDLKQGADALAGENEVRINLESPIYLTALFTPYLMQRESAIINVSSGLGFVPLAIAPIYCATKAAIHSYTLSLRHQLRNTPVKVFEVIPPIVDTELDKGARARRGQQDRGIQASEVAVAVMAGLEKDELEIPVGMAQNLRLGARSNPEQVFANMNRW